MIALLACTPPAPAPGPPRFVADTDAFDAVPSPPDADVFDAVTADADLDGDLDLFVNRHLLAPWELLLGDGDGRFVQVNRPGDDPTGLYENPGVPSLYADEDELVPLATTGLTIWHDVDRTGAWHLVVAADAAPVTLEVAVNEPLVTVEGHEPGEVVDQSELRVTLALDGPRHLRIRNELIGTMLEVVTTPAVPIAVGPDLASSDAAVQLWKPDPHGVAWADEAGSPEPDLFVCRGALQGDLVPPLPPKADHWFVSTGRATFASGAVPAGYGRGRQVAWADLDADGTDELFVSNTDTADQLLDPDGAGGFVDRAPELGLGLVPDDTFAVLDLDGDGRLDLLSGHGRELHALFLRPEGTDDVPGADLGLAWTADATTAADGIFNPLGLQVVDLDRDGDLDLLAADDEEVRWYAREGDAFVDRGSAGLPLPVGSPTLVPFDADLDGDLDVAVASAELWLGLNDGSGAFDAVRLDGGWRVDPGRVALAADVDRDGREDLVIVTSTDRIVARNETPAVGAPLVVLPNLPRGTLLRLDTADGHTLAVAWGANAVSRYSQGTRPIVVGQRDDDPIVAVRYRVPGAVDDVRVPVPPRAWAVPLP